MSGIAMLFPHPTVCLVTLEGELLLPLVVLEDLQLLGDAHGVPWYHLCPQIAKCRLHLVRCLFFKLVGEITSISWPHSLRCEGIEASSRSRLLSRPGRSTTASWFVLSKSDPHLPECLV